MRAAAFVVNDVGVVSLSHITDQCFPGCGRTAPRAALATSVTMLRTKLDFPLVNKQMLETSTIH